MAYQTTAQLPKAEALFEKKFNGGSVTIMDIAGIVGISRSTAKRWWTLYKIRREVTA